MTSGKLLNLSVPHRESGLWHPVNILQAFGKEVRSRKLKASQKRLVRPARDRPLDPLTVTARDRGRRCDPVTQQRGQLRTPREAVAQPVGTLPFYCPFRVFGERGEQETAPWSSFWSFPTPRLSLSAPHSHTHVHTLPLSQACAHAGPPLPSPGSSEPVTAAWGEAGAAEPAELEPRSLPAAGHDRRLLAG